MGIENSKKLLPIPGKTERDMNRKVRAKFTLVEVLMVIVIVSIIIAIGVGITNFAIQKMNEVSTKNLIIRLDHAITALYDQYGVYPNSLPDEGVLRFPVSSGGGIELNVEKLQDGNDSSLEDMSKEYITSFIDTVDLAKLLQNNSIRYGDYLVIVDAWSRPLYYRYPGNKNLKRFDLASAGISGRAFMLKIGNDDFDPTGDSDEVIAANWNKRLSTEEIWDMVNGILKDRRLDLEGGGSANPKDCNDEDGDSGVMLRFSSQYGEHITN